MDRKQTLKQRLEEAGIEQKSIAAALDLSRSLVSRIVVGVYPVRTPQASATRDAVLGYIAERLDVDVLEVEALVPRDTPEMRALEEAMATGGGPRALDRRTQKGRTFARAS